MGKHTAPEETPAVTEAASGGAEAAATARPSLYIVKGNPTPEEIAALTVVLAAASQGGEAADDAQKQVGGWGDPGSSLRMPLRPGPGAWRTSVR